eukprot:Hpha_TRINITY_DN3285_c0_g1::TRINITY_DN3285_c0_g1_i1::g.185844::m.185844
MAPDSPELREYVAEQKRCERAVRAYSRFADVVHDRVSVQLRCSQKPLCTRRGCAEVFDTLESQPDRERTRIIQSHGGHVCNDPCCGRRTLRYVDHLSSHVHVHGLTLQLAHLSTRQGNHLTNRQVAAIAEALEAHGKVSEITIIQCDITDALAVPLLRAAARTSSTPLRFTIHGGTLGASPWECEQALQEALHNPWLETLRLTGNKVGLRLVDTISQALASGSALKVLLLGDNPLDDAAVEVIADGVSRSRVLSLCLRSTRARRGFRRVGQALSHGCALTELRMRGNALGPAEVTSIWHGLARSNLRSLELAGCGLGPEAAAELRKAFPTSYRCSLTSLNLNDNLLGDHGAVEIAWMLTAPHKPLPLRTLGMRNNAIGGRGGETLMLMLAVNDTLTGVDISHNPCGPTAAFALAASLRTNVTIQSLDLADVVFDKKANRILAEALSDGRSTCPVRHLDLGGARSDDSSTRAWAEVIRSCPLERLSLARNHLSEQQVRVLVAALRDSRWAVKLNLSDGGGSAEGANNVSPMLQRTLKNLSSRPNVPAPSTRPTRSPSPVPGVDAYPVRTRAASSSQSYSDRSPDEGSQGPSRSTSGNMSGPCGGASPVHSAPGYYADLPQLLPLTSDHDRHHAHEGWYGGGHPQGAEPAWVGGPAGGARFRRQVFMYRAPPPPTLLNGVPIPRETLAPYGSHGQSRLNPSVEVTPEKDRSNSVTASSFGSPPPLINDCGLSPARLFHSDRSELEL